MPVFTFFNNDPFSESGHLFDDTFTRRTARGGTQIQGQQENTAPGVFLPRVDVHEDKNKNPVTATFELPSVNKENVSIDVHNNLLIVSGESKSESDRDEHGYVIRERRFDRFSCSLPVPEGVKPEEVKAAMENGVLTVTYPCQTEADAPKRITIS
ncbi:hypothetical protein V8D89_009440 [Ganoderma adspersum]